MNVSNRTAANLWTFLWVTLGFVTIGGVMLGANFDTSTRGDGNAIFFAGLGALLLVGSPVLGSVAVVIRELVALLLSGARNSDQQLRPE